VLFDTPKTIAGLTGNENVLINLGKPNQLATIEYCIAGLKTSKNIDIKNAINAK
jgi:hypothetical protein